MKFDNAHLPCDYLKGDASCYQVQDPGTIKCSVRVQKQVTGCNYTLEILCFQDVATPYFKCPTAFEIHLACGHRSQGSSGRCNGKDADMNPIVKHQKCTKIYGRYFGTCNHTCRSSCHDDTNFELCFAPCEV